METRVREVELAVEAGATEIDIVINRTLVLEGRWRELYEEVAQLVFYNDMGNFLFDFS